MLDRNSEKDFLLPFSIECYNTAWIANGYCEDEVNTKECNYDGGDCCGSCVNTEYCIKCECLEYGYIHDSAALFFSTVRND